MSNQQSPEVPRDVLEVPSVYVDHAEVHVMPFSVQLVLASHTLDGTAVPKIHLTISPSFAHHLRDLLSDSLTAYQVKSETVAPENPAPERPTAHQD